MMTPTRLPDGRTAVVLSAHADDLLRADARAIADYLDRFPETTVTQAARQLHTTRRVRGHRAVLRAANRPELVDALRALAAGREHPLLAASALDLRKRLNRVIGRTVSLATLMGEITGGELIAQLEGAGERPHHAQKVDIARD
ncbi:polyketide synthase [Mycobacterium bohemicum DSM 44277]|uniref:Polyketide synthase n=1 Tax=Mycobacterium bohemicum DSM 44277 TaxID=1236609 RepID=A0A0U0W7W7_MYCBE|nr:polyketide synthase [Mycobacterium bohemicum DSM 44277]